MNVYFRSNKPSFSLLKTKSRKQHKVIDCFREINHKIKLMSPITGLKYSEMKSVNLMIV